MISDFFSQILCVWQVNQLKDSVEFSFVLPQESVSAADILILLGLQNMQCVVTSHEMIAFSLLFQS